MKKTATLLISALVLAFSLALSVSAYADEPAPIDISTGTISMSVESFSYTESEKTPNITVTLEQTDELTGDKTTVTLVRNTDYTVSYENNINVGTATVNVSGIGSYTGNLSKSFEITPCNITSTKVKIKNTARAYPGKAPEYEVFFGDTKLIKDKDYTISVKNYKKAGVKAATVTFNGKGNFGNTKTLEVNVYPNKVTSFSTKNRTTTSLELHWADQKNLGATGYKVYTCDKNGNNIKYYATVSTNSCTVKKRKAGEYYYFIVRAICKSGDTTIVSEKSKVFKTCAKPATVSMKTVTKSKDKKKLTIKWSKVGCTGYEIEYSTDKDFKKGVKTVSVKDAKTTKKTVSIPKNDKVYYARVRAFRRYNNDKVTVYGSKSKKISSSFSKTYATYTTNYVRNANRTKNLKLACKAIDGTIVYPGETFSFNKTVGRRTEAKGYREAYVFTGPNSHQLGVGGGVCQVASTMFNAALLANFKIVERHQHSQRVTYCPLGRDAAIYWGSEDFKFKNTSDYPIKIKMSCGDGRLKCSYMVCYDVSPKKVSLSVSRNGNHFTLRRKVGGKTNYTTGSTY